MSRLILLAEDDAVTREVISTQLRGLGFAVDATASVREASELGAQRPYTALIFDRHLLGGDAIGLLQSIRAHADHPNLDTPAIAMSAELLDSDVDLLLAAGFADAIEKPASLARLQRALMQCGLHNSTGIIDARAAASEPTRNYERTEPLDDALGIQACGSLEVLLGLRALLAAELADYLAAIVGGIDRQDAAAVSEVLHRMKSALGFCGASEMLGLLAALQKAPLDRARFAGFAAGAQRLSDQLIQNR